jgi:TP901 family phage tail tape measure protein
MVEAGAKMGVAKTDLIGFTRQASIMATAFNLPAAQLADDVGKIANIYKIPISAIGQLGDAINYLGDQTLSDEGGIVNFLNRVGGVAASVKITGKKHKERGHPLASRCQ